MWTLEEHGDFLERQFSQFILEKIPTYSQIWCMYIGNDGTAHAAEMIEHRGEGFRKISEIEQQRRINYSEYQYTLLESLLLLDHLLKKDYHIRENFHDYFDLQNNFLAFHANSGRIRDNIRKMLFLFFEDGRNPGRLNERANELLNYLDDYYQQRNEVLHGKKLPFGSFEGELLIAKPKGEEEKKSLWESKRNWDDFEERDLEFAIEYLDETFNGLIQVANRLLMNIQERIAEILAKNNFRLVDPPEEPGMHGSSGKGFSGFKG